MEIKILMFITLYAPFNLSQDSHLTLKYTLFRLPYLINSFKCARTYVSETRVPPSHPMSQGQGYYLVKVEFIWKCVT